MPNTKSAKKRVKQNERNELRNRAAKSTMKSAIKTTTSAKGESAAKLTKSTQGLIARLWKRGVIHKNKASRLQSRLMRKVARSQKTTE